MVNNYPEYAAGVNYKKTDTNGNRHFYSAQVVADPANETVESKLIKDGVVIDEGGVSVEALNVTENGTYSEEGKAYSPVVVNVAGGGSSDFTTAEVTVINQTELPVALETVLLIDDDEKYLDVSTNIFGGQTKEIEVVLYNGLSADSTNINSNQVPITIAVTGDIEIVEATALSITGAGTITITADSET